MDLLDRMLDHDIWATQGILEHAARLTDEQLDRPFDIGNGSLRATLSHHIAAVAFWTAQMTSQPVPSSDPDPTATITSISDQFATISTTFATTARSLRDQNRLEDTFRDHSGNPISYSATILHVLHHSAGHRSEEQHMLHRLGVEEVWDYDPQEWEWSLR